MNKGKVLPSIADLQSLFSYNPETGDLIWKYRPAGFYRSEGVDKFNGLSAGKVAGFMQPDGYRVVRFSGYNLKAHRVAWAVAHGRWPEFDIDHINGDRSDNRLANMRDVAKSENNKNSSIKKNNKSGHNGVDYMPKIGQWRARISVDGKERHLGVFPNIDDAIAARNAASERYGYHQNHGTDRTIIRRDNTVSGVLVTVEAL